MSLERLFGLGRRGLSRARRVFGAESDPLVEVALGPRRVRLRRSVVPREPDYDDGWSLALARRSRVFLDAGCNVGIHTLLAALDDPSRQVLAIDANPAALAAAAETLFLNRVSTQARFALAFLSDREGERRRFFTVGSGAAGSAYAGHNPSAEAAGAAIEVETRTLDGILGELGLAPDLVKLDVEGAEAEALRGASGLARRGRTRFLVEVHATRRLAMAENVGLLLGWCGETGLSAHYLKEHRPLRDPASVAHRGRCHLLFQPVDWPYPSVLRGLPQGSSFATGAGA